AHVPILARIDMETYATKKYDLEKSKDESRNYLKLYKPIPEVFGSSGQTTRAMETTTDQTGEAIGEELVFHDALIPTFTHLLLERQSKDFPIPKFEELEDDVPSMDLLGEQPRVVGKHPRDVHHPELRGMTQGLSFFRVADSRHTTSNYRGYLPDPLSAKVATDATGEVLGATPPQTVVLVSGA
ncbi:hypothetical protein HAX54_033016, partial [Datura stramonium]|nr:hypothetical protein [Datura stramonium]